MFSSIFFTRRYRFRFGRIICYTFTFVALLLCVWMRYFRSSFEADGDDFDARRVAKWQRQRYASFKPCHLSIEDDALEVLRSNVTLPANSIFFHETSCKGDLTSRQVCVVESAAKAHPDLQINVFFTSPVSEETLNNGCISTLNHYKNVKLARVLITDYADGTPIASRIAQMSSEDLNIHMSKIMKFLSLYKYGGIYLSLDVIVARRLDLWKNWAVKESPKTLSSDMFAFSKNRAGKSLAQEALRILLLELEANLRHDLWSYGGPSVISKLLQYWCSTNNVEHMTLSKCKDLAVHGPELFYPISFHGRKEYFRIVDWEKWKKNLIHTYFLWHRFTKYNIVTPGSLYGRIASEYCPVTYHGYSDMAGVWYPDKAMPWSEIKTTYRPDLWIHNGPGAITRVLNKTCQTTDLAKWSSNTCQGLEVYSPEYFYPLHYSLSDKYFKPGELKFENAYAHHFWNKLTYFKRIEKNSLYEKMAQKYCPTIYEMYGEEFGSYS